MERPALLQLQGQDQFELMMSCLNEVVGSGTTVVFSFPSPQRVLVLFAEPKRRAGLAAAASRTHEDLSRAEIA